MQLLAVLREFRGSAHLVALRAVGVESKTAHFVKRPNDIKMFGWREADAPEITDATHAAMAEAEALTDRIVAPAYAVLDDAQRQDSSPCSAGSQHALCRLIASRRATVISDAEARVLASIDDARRRRAARRARARAEHHRQRRRVGAAALVRRAPPRRRHGRPTSGSSTSTRCAPTRGSPARRRPRRGLRRGRHAHGAETGDGSGGPARPACPR